jgi:hypothetical protein
MSKKRKAQEFESSSDSESGSDDDFDVSEMLAVNQDLLKEVKGEESRPFSNNVEALRLKTMEIALPKEWPWVETLTVSTLSTLDAKLVHDDLAREVSKFSSTCDVIVNVMSCNFVLN